LLSKNVVRGDGAAVDADTDTATATESDFHDVQIEYKGAMNRPGFIGKMQFYKTEYI
jgi:hypothetical protein